MAVICHPKPYASSQLPEISPETFQYHLSIYRGIVAVLNDIRTQLETVRTAKINCNYMHCEYRTLKAEESHAQAAVRLHELHFESFSSIEAQVPHDLASGFFTESFGSYEAWVLDFMACALSARGYAILAWDVISSVGQNAMLDDADKGLSPGLLPILVLDVHEHAYWSDYGSRRKDYITMTMRHIDWLTLRSRLESAVNKGTTRSVAMQPVTAINSVEYYRAFPLTRMKARARVRARAMRRRQ